MMSWESGRDHDQLLSGFSESPATTPQQNDLGKPEKSLPLVANQQQEPNLTRPESLQAGRELDALIAEKVFGAQVCWFSIQDVPHGEEWLPGDGGAMPNHEMLLPDEKAWTNIPHYSTDIAAAWTVAEKLREDGWILELTNTEQPAAGFWLLGGIRGRWALRYCPADTAPLAICLASLRALPNKTTQEGDPA